MLEGGRRDPSLRRLYTLSSASSVSISENDCVPLAHVFSAFIFRHIISGITGLFYRLAVVFAQFLGGFFFSIYFFSVSLDGTAQ